MHTSDELVQVERLRNVIVGAEIQTAQLVGLVTPRRHNQYRDTPVAPQRGTQLETARIRQHDVENDQIGRECSCARQRALAVSGPIHVEAFVQKVLAHECREVGIVFDDEHPFLHQVLVYQSV
jgi:hypothetical protein